MRHGAECIQLFTFSPSSMHRRMPQHGRGHTEARVQLWSIITSGKDRMVSQAIITDQGMRDRGQFHFT